MRMADGTIRIHFVQAARATMLRAGCVFVLLLCVSGCGGGAGDAPPLSSMPTAAPTPASGTSQPPAAPEPLIVGTAQSIDNGANGDPVSLRVARSANGDGFAVWKADNGGIVPSGGSHHDLWANRYSAATAAWDGPIKVVAGSTEIEEFDLAVDATGNAVIAWNAITDPFDRERGMVMSARFNTGDAAWAAPVPLNTGARFPRVASDATGAVLAVYVVSISSPPLVSRVRGRFFDPASGVWQPEAAIEQNNGSTGSSFDPTALLDGSGNAFVGFVHEPGVFERIASNYYSRSAGSWGQLPPDSLPDAILGEVSGFGSQVIPQLQLATTNDGNFVAAWEERSAGDGSDTQIFTALFMGRSRSWSPARLLVQRAPPQPQRDDGLRFPGQVRLERIASNAAGNTLVLWTEGLTADGSDTAFNRTRRALKAIRVNPAGASCSAVQVVDSALGGGAAGADLGIDPAGNAIAIWQQFESPFIELSRSNIAINRFDAATGTWAAAVLAELQSGNGLSPRASVPMAGQALLGWIQAEGDANRVKALLQPMNDTPGR